MSRQLKERITCPKCGHDDEVIIWNSLNNVLSPNEAEKLLYGNLFSHTCPECGNTLEMCYECLYHDMVTHAMVQYVPSEDQAEATVAHLDSFLDGDVPHNEMDKCGYRYRIVFDHNRLREKARIFHDGLDERAIEVLKLMIEAMASENAGSMGALTIYYENTGEDGSLNFAVLGEEVGIGTVPRPAYDNLHSLPTDGPDRDYFIDRGWAIDNYTRMTGGDG